MAHTAAYAVENGGRPCRCSLTSSNPGNDSAAGQRAAFRCLMA